MDITWFGRSCFRLQTGSIRILTDPFDLPFEAASLTADIVTLSRRMPADRILAKPPYRVVDGPGEYEIKGVPVTGVATLPAPDPDAPGSQASPARNFIYSILVDGLSVCHLGRLNYVPLAQYIQEIGLPDVALIPLGEPEGLPVQRAVTLASQLEAKLLVPVSVGQPGDRSVLESFCRELGADPASTETHLTVTSSALPAQARVAVLLAQQPVSP